MKEHQQTRSAVEINPLFVISADSLTIAQRLREVPPGGTCSYAELTTLIRRNVQKEARFCLTSARRLLQREEQILFAPIRGKGVKRLTDEEITQLGPATIRRINRASHRGAHQLICVKEVEKLPLEARTRLNMSASLIGVFYNVSKAQGVKQIEQVVRQINRELPLRDALSTMLANAS